MTAKSPAPNDKANAKSARAERLATALRANLKRRKAAIAPAKPGKK